MTREERNTKLKHFITCLKCEVSGKVCDDNCPVQYEAGNMGEIIENLEAISKVLEQEPCEDEYIKVPKKALKYRTAGMVAYNAEWLKNHFDIERAVICGEQEPCKTQMIDKSNFSQEQYKADLQCAYDCGKASVKPCEDAISRQAVLDKKELIELEDGQSFYCIGPEDVETLPPVNPQPKTGHWINGDCEGGNCSICGKYYAFYPESGDFNYCPNCGAKMIDPQESEG